MNENKLILIISATEQIAVPFIDMIKSELEENEMLIEDFGIKR